MARLELSSSRDKIHILKQQDSKLMFDRILYEPILYTIGGMLKGVGSADPT